MQSESSARTDLSGTVGGAGRVALLLALLSAAGGCSNGSGTPRLAPRKPHDGVALRVVCADPAVAQLVRRQSAGWAGRTGAAVTVVAAAPDADSAADVVVVPPAEVGAWAAKGDARAVPKAIRGDDQAVGWSRILTTYRDRLTAWGPEVRAVPLAGDGYVLVYRADKFTARQQGFRGKTGRPLDPPASWEDVAEVAEYFADADGQPSLPPVPADPAALLREFHFAAACYDRPALSESALIQRTPSGFDTAAGNRALSFHHDVETGKPRLSAPGFAAAADWLKRVSRCRMKAGSATDAVAALDAGTAVVALLTLAELGRLPKDGDTLSDRFGIAPPPGTRGWFDPTSPRTLQPPPDRVKGVNYVPYYGSGGWVGIVREKCGSPDAAFELLAELAGPARGADALSDPGLGFGPYRSEHLEQQRAGVWQRYGLDPARSKRLAEALRQYTAPTLANPAFAPRSPDQRELLAALEKEVRRAADGQASGTEAMAAAQQAWQELDAKRLPTVTAEWRRKSAGLE